MPPIDQPPGSLPMTGGAPAAPPPATQQGNSTPSPATPPASPPSASGAATGPGAAAGAGAAGKPPATPPQEPPPVDWQDRYYSTVSQKDAELWQTKQALQAATKAAQDAQARFEAWKKDPYKALEELGGDLKSYAQRVVNDGQPGPEEKIAVLEKQLEELRGWRESAAEQEKREREEGYYKGYAEDVKKTWSAKDEFKPFNHWVEVFELATEVPFNLSAEVKPLISDHYNRTGRMLPPEEVSRMFAPVAQSRLDKLADHPAIIERVLKKHAAQQAQQGQGGSQSTAQGLPGGGHPHPHLLLAPQGRPLATCPLRWAASASTPAPATSSTTAR